MQTRPRNENMNFDDTPQEAAFRSQARAWIAANAPRQYEEELKKSSLGRTQLKGANILEVAKAWQKKKADAGWACLHWPKEYGGRGASPKEPREAWGPEGWATWFETALARLLTMRVIQICKVGIAQRCPPRHTMVGSLRLAHPTQGSRHELR
jgi:alkylation response protein AidB-like acyl-CoA dehydrogenase